MWDQIYLGSEKRFLDDIYSKKEHLKFPYDMGQGSEGGSGLQRTWVRTSGSEIPDSAGYLGSLWPVVRTFNR